MCKWWRVLVIVRFLLVLWPQSGYIHPDEFFQCGEPMAGAMLQYDVEVPWEFHPEAPLRSVAFPVMVAGLPYVCMQQLFALIGTSIPAYLLLVVPRLVITAAAFAIDHSLYAICHLLASQHTRSVMLVYASSYIVLTYYTRTFSNTIEAILFAVLYKIIIAARYSKGKEVSAFVLGCLVSLGIFIRPTFALFAITPLCFWVYTTYKNAFSFETLSRESIKRVRGNDNNYERPPLQQGWRCVWHSMRNIVSGCVWTSLALITIDTVYYSLQTVSNETQWNYSLLRVDSSKLLEFWRKAMVVTPVNFIMYNFDQENLSTHGTHPRYLHVLVNLPLLFGALPLVVLWRAWQKRGERVLKADTLLHAFSFVTPVLLLSAFPHQEPRFLIPCLVPLVLLCAANRILPTFLLLLCAFHNVSLLVLYGFLHQGGIIPLISHLQEEIYSKSGTTTSLQSAIIFHHTYMPPRHLMSIDSNYRNQLTVYDMKGESDEKLRDTVSKVLDDTDPGLYHVYIVIPATVKTFLCEHNVEYDITLLNSFQYHTSFEDLPTLAFSLFTISTKCNLCSNCSLWSSIKHALSLNLYKVTKR